MKLIFSIGAVCAFILTLVVILFEHVFPFFGIPNWLGVTLVVTGALTSLIFPSDNNKKQLESSILTGRRLDRILESIEKLTSVANKSDKTLTSGDH